MRYRGLSATLLVLVLLASLSPVAAHTDSGTTTSEQATPPSAAGVRSEPLLEVTFPAEVQPPIGSELTFTRFTLPPDADDPAPLVQNAGIGLTYVMSGEYGVRVDRPLHVTHAVGQAPQEVPAEAEAEIGPGEAFVYHAFAAPRQRWNPGSEPAVLLSLLLAPPQASGPLPPGARYEDLGLLRADQWADVPPGAFTVTMRRLTIAPGTSLPSVRPEAAYPLLRFVEGGTMEWQVVRPDPETSSAPLRFGAGDVIPFTTIRGEGDIALRNVGAEPAVLLELAITSANGMATPAAAPAPQSR